MAVQLEKIKAYKTLPTINSSDIIWQNWYKQLEQRYGAPDAARIFLPTWSKQGTSKANTYALRKELSKDGITIDENIFTKIEDIGGGLSDAFTGFAKAGKIATYTVGGILIVGLGILVFNLARTPDKVLQHIK